MRTKRGSFTVIKNPKYHSRAVHVDGIYFRSELEAEYYGQLKYRHLAKEFTKFTLQPKFDIRINDVFLFAYHADFAVFRHDGYIDVIDTKGFETPIYKLKRRAFCATYLTDFSLFRFCEIKKQDGKMIELWYNQKGDVKR